MTTFLIGLLVLCALLLTLCLCILSAALYVLFQLWKGDVIFPSFADAPWRDKNHYA